ncbi:MAG TPA: hypothetical protein VD905_08895, partial [Flavobacteriales bacterium]|nr:hypothetical protein [Flavobacteriales bacterium]
MIEFKLKLIYDAMHKMFIILLILIPAISFSQDDPRDILQNSYNILNKKKSVAYKATLRVKFFSGTDTSTHKAYVCLERQPADSIFGARVFLKFGNDWNKIYDLKNVYVLEIKTKKGMRYEPKHNWAIEGNINAGVIWRDFIHPDNILFRLDTANRLKLAGDTLINKTMCWKITINYPDEDEYSDQKRIMCVSKKEYVCLFTSFQTKFQGNYEYNALSLSSVEFDKQNVKEISERIVKEYKVEPYREPTPEEQAEMYRLLDTTSMAPVLKGKIYGSA